MLTKEEKIHVRERRKAEEVAESVRFFTGLPLYQKDLPLNSHDRLVYTKGFAKAVELFMGGGGTVMIAKDLFEDLGFEEKPGDEFEVCSYVGDNTKVVFCTDRYIEYHYPTKDWTDEGLEPQEVSFSCDDVMAMYEKCKELGWLE